jgi:hypothetical protein
MPDGGLVDAERSLLKAGGMKRSPAGLLAVRDHTVGATEHAAVRFANGEDGESR